MATGGGRFVKSVKESDIFYDKACSPCEKDGKNVEAVKRCADCDENLCGSCLAHHNRFAMMRGHKLLDPVQTCSGKTKQLPSRRCVKHGGKIIDVYCPMHDAVGCSTCVSVHHSSCEGKQYIPDVATGIKTSQELKEMEKEMKTLKSKLDALKKLKRVNLQRLKQEKNALIKEIQFIRKKMNDQLDQMEKCLVEEAEKKFRENIEVIHSSIQEVDSMLETIDQAMNEMKSDDNDVDIFACCKEVKREIADIIEPTFLRVEKQPHQQSFYLHTDETAKLIMEGKVMLASLTEKINVKEAVYLDDIAVKVPGDDQVCGILYMCSLPDGCLVMSDENNKKLKKLDLVTNNVSTMIDLSDIPGGICLVDNTRLAVCLYNQKKIQFVTLSNTVTLGDSFPVGDRCRDVDHCDGLLYVCCGGSLKPERNEGRGHIEVYTCSGDLLRCFYEDVGLPLFISVVSVSGCNPIMYTADTYTGFHVRGLDGGVRHKFKTALNTYLPFCLIGTDQLCIGEMSTGSISIHTETHKTTLVDCKKFNGKPCDLYFDKTSSRLFVSVNMGPPLGGVIKMYQLKM